MIKEGLKLLQKKRFSEALIIFDKIIKSNHEDSDALFCLGNIYYELNDLTKSLNFYEKSLKKYTDSEVILNNYAIVLQSMGKIKEAKEIFLKLIKLNPNNVKAYYRLFRMNNNNFNKNYLNTLKSLEKNKNLSLSDKSLINFIFSKAEKNKNKIQNEIHFLNKAHEFHFNNKIKHNLKITKYYKNILVNKFNKISFFEENNKNNFVNDNSPVFIIGLPRSGSTLVESLLMQSNKKYYSYGESGIFDKSIFEQIENNILKNFDLDNLEIKINEEFLFKSTQNLYFYTGGKNFIDKSLENFFYIDVILKLYPKAKFIHTFRNRFDSAIAIYQSMLIHLPWAHSINNILGYILSYEKVINFYKKKYPDKILDIELEKFTSKPKIYSKKIYNFCSLNWDDNNLNFHNNENLTSKTSSFLQVRNKIEKSIINKYQSYYYLLEKEKINFN